MTELGRCVFVCSKPLQFMMCTSIVREFGVRDAVIFIVTRNFSHVSTFVDFMTTPQMDSPFRSVDTRKTHADIAREIAALEYDSLFIESDRVSDYHVYSPLKRELLAVFEEGAGTYVADYRDGMTGLRRLKWTVLALLTGCGLDFGGGRATDRVFVQFPDLYASLRPRNAQKAIGIPRVAVEMLRTRTQWAALLKSGGLGGASRMARAALVLGTWGGLPVAARRAIATDVDGLYYKGHPNDEVTVELDGAQIITPRWVPGEVIVDWLVQRSDQVVVYHFGSSIEMNLWNTYPTVKFVDLGGPPEVALIRERLTDAARMAQ